MKKKVVIALGGNALGKTNEEQIKLVKSTAIKIVDIISNGYDVVITHGNGPQVGMISSSLEGNAIPFSECGAMSEGYIGYHLSQAIVNELRTRGINKSCVSVLTQVVVDKDDTAFDNPTKPIGNFYSKEDASLLSDSKGYIMKEDAGRGYRRVVASPKPLEIVEFESINELISSGHIVIACGGGGIPVVLEDDKFVGVDAVIDKDLTSALLAEKIDADYLLILTGIDKVCINFDGPDEKKLDILSLSDAYKYISNNEFAEGSMLPKIEACLKFVKNTNKYAVITSLDEALNGLDGKSGTLVCSSKEDI